MYDLQGRELATFLQRFSAYLLDSLFSTVPLVVFLVSLGVSLFFSFGDEDVRDSGRNDGVFYAVFAVMVVSLVLSVGYLVWWLIALRQGQTPGKQIAGIRVIRVDGSPSGWGFTFLREVVIKGMLGALLSGITGGIYWVVDHLWPLWDANRQALHDKMMNTVVVQNPRQHSERSHE